MDRFVNLIDLYQEDVPRALDLEASAARPHRRGLVLDNNEGESDDLWRRKPHLEAQISLLQSQLATERQRAQQNQELEEQNSILRQRLGTLEETERQTSDLVQQVPRLQHQIAALQEKERLLPELYRRINALEAQITALREQEKAIPGYHEQIALLKESGRENARDVPILRQQIERQAAHGQKLATEIQQLKEALATSEHVASKTHSEIEEKQQASEQLLREMERLKGREIEIQRLRRQLEMSTRAHQKAKERAQMMSTSTSWRMTAPLRWFLNRLRPKSRRSRLTFGTSTGSPTGRSEIS